jgi:hypothetical protein
MRWPRPGGCASPGVMRLNTVRMVRPMISRTYAAGFVVILGIGSMLAPTETFGRSAGFVGRPFPVASGFRPAVLRAPAKLSPQTARSRLHRRQFGFGVPLIVSDDTVSYGPYYDPSGYVGLYDQPSYADPDLVTRSIADGPLAAHRPGCRSQTVTVPSEGGGERPINVVRC